MWAEQQIFSFVIKKVTKSQKVLRSFNYKMKHIVTENMDKGQFFSCT